LNYFIEQLCVRQYRGKIKKDMSKLDQLNEVQLSYIAGFLDGNGSIVNQIVRAKDRKFKHTIRVSVNYHQKTKRHWFMIKLKKMLGEGSLRKKNDGTSQLTITGFKSVKRHLEKLKPFLHLKKDLAGLTLNIIEDYEKVNTKASFLEVCKKIDKTANYTDGKKRVHTFASVNIFLDQAVETEKSN